MKPVLSATLLLAWACSILLLGPDVFVAAKKKKKSPSPKPPKMVKYGKAKAKKQGQCLTSDYLEARATAVKNELSGEYITCSYSAFYTLYINGSFVEYPFFSDYEGDIATISSVDSSPHTNLALFNIEYNYKLGPLYNNSVIKQDYIGKWDFVDEELVEVPANNDGTQYRVSKTHSCQRFLGNGYPTGTLYCNTHSMYNDVNDLAKDFDPNDEEPRNTAIYSLINDMYYVPTEFGGCPCAAEEDTFSYDPSTMPTFFSM
jgi:hypothetical protein